MSIYRHILASVAAILLSCPTVFADTPQVPSEPTPEDARIRAYRGYYYTDMGTGEGQEMMIVLNEVKVFPPLVFKNKKEEEYYWKTVRDVRRTLPYAKLICETMLETYEYIETFPTQKEREEYLKQMEGAIFQQYKPVLKRFSRNQAKILIKLIKRETDQNSYNIIKAFLGSFRAGFWQGFGRLFGVNLKADYAPDKDRKDYLIERIAVDIELGRL